MVDINQAEQNKPEKQETIRNADGTWPQGVSGNPNGRPKKGNTLTDIMREMFETDGNIPRAIVAKLLSMAASGDIAAIREVLDRIEGKPIQPNAEIGEDKMSELLHIYKPEKLPAKGGA